MQTLIDEGKLKDLFKKALFEALNENRQLFQDMITEAIEDIALANAIQEGAASGTADKQEIFDILDGKA